MFVVDIVNETKIYSKVCSICKQDTDYWQDENMNYISDCCNSIINEEE